MDEDVHRLLVALQDSNQGPRQQAEAALTSLYSQNGFPLALITIASTDGLDLTVRQAAAVYMRIFIDEVWQPPYERYQGPPLLDETKTEIRHRLLGLLGNQERRIRAAAAFAVSKIAGHDFPEEWPNLLQDLLVTIPNATNEQLHGTLKVLNDLVEDGFSEDQFFAVANQLVETIYNIAMTTARPNNLRALAIQIFKSCVELLEMVKEDHPAPVQDFASKMIDGWVPLFISVIEAPLAQEKDLKAYGGLVALKLQSLKAILKIIAVFPNGLTKFMLPLFTVTWAELNSIKDRYVEDFVTGDAEGHLTDVDGLPYTLDLLMLEEVDFLQSCLRSRTVKDEFAKALQTSTDPLDQMVHACICLAQVTSEEETMWEEEINIYLSEETSVTANYTARTACGDLIMKLVDWLGGPAMISLFKHSNHLFSMNASWKMLEANLFLLDQSMTVSGSVFCSTIQPDLASTLFSAIEYALKNENVFLRARGYTLAGSLAHVKSGPIAGPVLILSDRAIEASVQDPSDIVKISCIRAIATFIEHLDKGRFVERQASIISAVGTFLHSQPADELEDRQEVLGALAETLRTFISLNPSASLDPNLHVVEILFQIASGGAESNYLTSQIQEAFDDIILALPDQYPQLCQLILPPINNALDADTYQEENPVSNLAAELLTTLLRNASSPLPAGMVDVIMPRLSRCLLNSNESLLLQFGAEALKCLVEFDIKQLLAWHGEDGKSGMEVVLVIIDRLLRPELPDQSALEVGGLAAELVDKASAELGQFLPELLRAVAGRLATAQAANLIQSLILVFARLVIARPKDVVDFLASITIGSVNGLQVVMSAWLDNSNVFSGYSEIKQNIIALTHLFTLADPRLTAVNVQGDQIITQSTRIMTRAATRNNPIRYTIVSVPLKIIKLLIVELQSGASAGASSWKADAANAAADEAASDDGEWEDEDILDLGSFATKQSLLALGEDDDGRPQSRLADDETQDYLMQFFREASSKNLGGFQEVYAQLSPEEQGILSSLVR